MKMLYDQGKSLQCFSGSNDQEKEMRKHIITKRIMETGLFYILTS